MSGLADASNAGLQELTVATQQEDPEGIQSVELAVSPDLNSGASCSTETIKKEISTDSVPLAKSDDSASCSTQPTKREISTDSVPFAKSDDGASCSTEPTKREISTDSVPFAKSDDGASCSTEPTKREISTDSVPFAKSDDSASCSTEPTKREISTDSVPFAKSDDGARCSTEPTKREISTDCVPCVTSDDSASSSNLSNESYSDVNCFTSDLNNLFLSQEAMSDPFKKAERVCSTLKYFMAWKKETNAVLSKFRKLAFVVIKLEGTTPKVTLNFAANQVPLEVKFNTERITDFTNNPVIRCFVLLDGITIASEQHTEMDSAKFHACESALQNILMPYMKLIPKGPPNSKELQLQVSQKPIASLLGEPLNFPTATTTSNLCAQSMYNNRVLSSNPFVPVSSFHCQLSNNLLPDPILFPNQNTLCAESSSQSLITSHENLKHIDVRTECKEYKNLEELIILESDPNPNRDSGRILNRSATLSFMRLQYDYSNIGNFTRCTLKIEDKVVADVSGRHEGLARSKASDEALVYLKKICWTMETKENAGFDSVISREDINAKEVNEQGERIDDDNIGNKMLRKMGWTGGGIGKRGDGIIEPVSLKQVFRRNGLGSNIRKGDHSTDEFRLKLRKVLVDFSASDNQKDLVFSKEFKGEEKMIIKTETSRQNLKSEMKRGVLVVSRKQSIKELFDHVNSVGGETSQYKLVPPSGGYKLQITNKISSEIKNMCSITDKSVLDSGQGGYGTSGILKLAITRQDLGLGTAECVTEEFQDKIKDLLKKFIASKNQCRLLLSCSLHTKEYAFIHKIRKVWRLSGKYSRKGGYFKFNKTSPHEFYIELYQKYMSNPLKRSLFGENNSSRIEYAPGNDKNSSDDRVQNPFNIGVCQGCDKSKSIAKLDATDDDIDYPDVELEDTGDEIGTPFETDGSVVSIDQIGRGNLDTETSTPLEDLKPKTWCIHGRNGGVQNLFEIGVWRGCDKSESMAKPDVADDDEELEDVGGQIETPCETDGLVSSIDQSGRGSSDVLRLDCTRESLGLYMNKNKRMTGEFQKKIKELMENFAADNNLTRLLLHCDLQLRERKVIHRIGSNLELGIKWKKNGGFFNIRQKKIVRKNKFAIEWALSNSSKLIAENALSRTSQSSLVSPGFLDAQPMMGNGGDQIEYSCETDSAGQSNHADQINNSCEMEIAGQNNDGLAGIVRMDFTRKALGLNVDEGVTVEFRDKMHEMVSDFASCHSLKRLAITCDLWEEERICVQKFCKGLNLTLVYRKKNRRTTINKKKRGLRRYIKQSQYVSKRIYDCASFQAYYSQSNKTNGREKNSCGTGTVGQSNGGDRIKNSCEMDIVGQSSCDDQIKNSCETDIVGQSNCGNQIKKSCETDTVGQSNGDDWIKNSCETDIVGQSNGGDQVKNSCEMEIAGQNNDGSAGIVRMDFTRKALGLNVDEGVTDEFREKMHEMVSDFVSLHYLKRLAITCDLWEQERICVQKFCKGLNLSLVYRKKNCCTTINKKKRGFRLYIKQSRYVSKPIYDCASFQAYYSQGNKTNGREKNSCGTDTVGHSNGDDWIKNSCEMDSVGQSSCHDQIKNSCEMEIAGQNNDGLAGIVRMDFTRKALGLNVDEGVTDEFRDKMHEMVSDLVSCHNLKRLTITCDLWEKERICIQKFCKGLNLSLEYRKKSRCTTINKKKRGFPWFVKQSRDISKPIYDCASFQAYYSQRNKTNSMENSAGTTPPLEDAATHPISKCSYSRYDDGTQSSNNTGSGINSCSFPTPSANFQTVSVSVDPKQPKRSYSQSSDGATQNSDMETCSFTTTTTTTTTPTANVEMGDGTTQNSDIKTFSLITPSAANIEMGDGATQNSDRKTCSLTTTSSASTEIDTLKGEYESDTEWALRRQFIIANKDSLPLDRLVCLSRCLANIVVYKCSYPPSVMQEVSERSNGIVEKVESIRKTAV